MNTEIDTLLTTYASTTDWGEEAAVRLLIAQGHWPREHAFTRHLTFEHGRITGIDWEQIARVPDRHSASRDEQAILRLACHLAGHQPRQTTEAWSIAEIVTSLDPTNSLLASRAVAMTALGPDAVGPLT